MLENLAAFNGIPFLLVFLEGLLSFFSPCVIPLIPVYISYLAGNAKKSDESGAIYYDRIKVFFHTVFFILGISFSYFILGMSFSSLGVFFTKNQLLFTRIGGILIILMGLFQIGILDLGFLQRERKFHLNLNKREANPLIAVLMGFTFSFAWTPCIGPALSSVLIMVSSSHNKTEGNLLIFIYILGFIIPFLLLGIFTTQVLNFIRKNQKFLKYTVKIAGILLLLIGIMIYTGKMNQFSRYLNTFVPSSGKNTTNSTDNNSANNSAGTTIDKDNIVSSDTTNQDINSQESKTLLPPKLDFTLKDQYGKEHTLSDYKGKVVFLNFWATWCPPCKEELPHIEEIYQEFKQNKEDVIILTVANPSSKDHQNNQDITKDKIIDFINKNGYTFPVVFDETGEVLRNYSISAFPTTFMINKDGKLYGYVPGKMTKDIMENIIGQTIDSTK